MRIHLHGTEEAFGGVRGEKERERDPSLE